MTTLLCYNSPEYSIILDVFQNTKLDKWIAQSIESFIYEWKEERYESGTLKCRYLTRFGEKEGEYKEFWENGQLYLHCNFKEGKEEGEYKAWWQNGQLWCHCYFKKGEKEGYLKKWLADGRLDLHCYLKHGEFTLIIN